MSAILTARISFRAVALVTAINVLVSAGFAAMGVVNPAAVLPAGAAPNSAAFIFALYAAARAVAIAGVALILIYKRAVAGLVAVGALAGVVQILDGGIGLFQADTGKTVGPLAIAALQFAALWPLRRFAAADGDGAFR